MIDFDTTQVKEFSRGPEEAGGGVAVTFGGSLRLGSVPYRWPLKAGVVGGDTPTSSSAAGANRSFLTGDLLTHTQITGNKRSL